MSASSHRDPRSVDGGAADDDAYFDTLEAHAPADSMLGRRAREICFLLLTSNTAAPELAELSTDVELAEEVRSRLDACGLEIHHARSYGRYLVSGAADLRDQGANGGLREAELAALGYLFVHLHEAPAPHDGKPTMLVADFCERFGKQRGWNRRYVRSAVIGPLERHDYIRVVTPGDRRSEAYLSAGPRMALIDRRRLLSRLDREALRAIDERDSGQGSEG